MATKSSSAYEVSLRLDQLANAKVFTPIAQVVVVLSLIAIVLKLPANIYLPMYVERRTLSPAAAEIRKKFRCFRFTGDGL